MSLILSVCQKYDGCIMWCLAVLGTAMLFSRTSALLGTWYDYFSDGGLTVVWLRAAFQLPLPDLPFTSHSLAPPR